MEKRLCRKKAGHRSWAAKGQLAPGAHRGDIMSSAKRSALMSRIRGKNTGPERILVEELVALGLSFETHPSDLDGRPDILFRVERLAVFVDGDFWHGWRFPLWKHKLSPPWRNKIATNRARDNTNFRRLRRAGWMVLRIWEHQVEQALPACIDRILAAIRKQSRLDGRINL
jgi:DNA mismatch endonuclease (patch repair protein)